jgi:hypothetical protein
MEKERKIEREIVKDRKKKKKTETKNAKYWL